MASTAKGVWATELTARLAELEQIHAAANPVGAGTPSN